MQVCDIEMGVKVQTLVESTLSVSITGNEPVTSVPLDEENNENEINNGNETVNIPLPPSDDVEFYIRDVPMLKF